MLEHPKQIIERLNAFISSVNVLKVESLPVVGLGETPRPFVVYNGKLNIWVADNNQYEEVSGGGGGGPHTHIAADITDLDFILNALQASIESYADGLFDTITGTPIPAVAFDTIAEIAAELASNNAQEVVILTALGNRVRIDINNQGLSLTEKTNAKTNIGLENVDNTSDLNKPISIAVGSALAGKSDLGHNHDDRYYTETETNTLLLGKAPVSHDHDDRYYTESQVDSMFTTITQKGSIVFEFYNGGQDLVLGMQDVPISVPFNAIVNGWEIMAYDTDNNLVSCDCVVDILSESFGGLPVLGSSITGTESPTLVSEDRNHNYVLTSFFPIAINTYIQGNLVTTSAGVARIVTILYITKS